MFMPGYACDVVVHVCVMFWAAVFYIQLQHFAGIPCGLTVYYCVCVCMYICMHLYVYAYMFVCVCVCMCVCVRA